MTGAALGLHALLTGRTWADRIQSGIPLAAGFAAGIAPLAIWLLATNTTADFWNQVVVFNLEQAASHGERLGDRVMERFAWIFGQANGALWTLAAVGAVVLGLRRKRPLVFWGGAKLMQSYFLWVVPPFALLAGAATAWVWERFKDARVRTVFVGLVVLGLLLTSDFQRAVTLRVLHERWPNKRVLDVDEQIIATIPHGGSLYIWGGSTHIYTLTNSTPPTRHLHAFTLSLAESSFPSYEARRAELMRDLRANPPALFLVSPATTENDPDGTQGTDLRTFPELAGFLQQQYTDPAPVVPGLGWEAYRRRDGV
jgi:hypothetical protein